MSFRLPTRHFLFVMSGNQIAREYKTTGNIREYIFLSKHFVTEYEKSTCAEFAEFCLVFRQRRTHIHTHMHARSHTSNHAWMSGEASKNVFSSIQDQSRLLFNDDVSLKNIVGDRWMNDYEVFVVWYWQEETEIIVGKPVSGPQCLSQISYWPTWIWTSAYAVRGRLVIAIPWPGSIQMWHFYIYLISIIPKRLFFRKSIVYCTNAGSTVILLVSLKGEVYSYIWHLWNA